MTKLIHRRPLPLTHSLNLLLALFLGLLDAGPAWASSSANEHFIRESDFRAYQLPSLRPEGGEKNWDPNDSLFMGRISCTYPKCVSLEEVTKTITRSGYIKKENLELVIQARMRVLQSLGRLLPRLEIRLGDGVLPTSILSTLSNLLGFILPSNWFNWQESKLIYAAQKSSYHGLLRNLVTDSESVYYNIHRVEMDLKIYQYYESNLQSLIDDIKQRNTDGKISLEDIQQLENYLYEVKTNAAFLFTVLTNWHPEDLALAMAYPDRMDLGIAPIDLPDLNNVSAYVATPDDSNRVRVNSNDLLTMRYLVRASKYARLSRIFNFLSAGLSGTTPTIGISLGLDNVAAVRISSSEKRVLETKLAEATARLDNLFRKLVETYNGCLDLYKMYVEAKVPNRALFHTVLGKYSTDRTLSAPALIRAIEWALKFELNRNFVQHLFLITKSQMDNLLLKGDRYTELTNFLPANAPLDRRGDRIKLLENSDIDRDIRKGVLDLSNP